MAAIIFDFDGTLVDSFDAVVECVNRVCQEYAFPEIEDSYALRMLSLRQLVKKWKIPWFRIPALAHRIKQLYAGKLLRFHKGVEQMLEALAEQHELYLLTSNSREAVEKTLAIEGCDPFEKIYADVSVFAKHRKIKSIVRKRGLENAIYVGDEIRDITASKKAGVKVVAVAWGYNFPEALRKAQPDMFAETPEDLIEMLR
ncbi:MAG: HAD hydrolase-like protein [Nanoarchaeota archaeon]